MKILQLKKLRLVTITSRILIVKKLTIWNQNKKIMFFFHLS